MLGGSFFGNKFDSVQFGKDLEALRNFYLENRYVKFPDFWNGCSIE